eukprot:1313297-Prymnesium_polylepis.2
MKAPRFVKACRFATTANCNCPANSHSNHTKSAHPLPGRFQPGLSCRNTRWRRDLQPHENEPSIHRTRACRPRWRGA